MLYRQVKIAGRILIQCNRSLSCANNELARGCKVAFGGITIFSQLPSTLPHQPPFPSPYYALPAIYKTHATTNGNWSHMPMLLLPLNNNPCKCAVIRQEKRGDIVVNRCLKFALTYRRQPSWQRTYRLYRILVNMIVFHRHFSSPLIRGLRY